MHSSRNIHSVSQYDFAKHGIELIVERESQNYVEIAVKNKNFPKNKQTLQRWFVVLSIIYLISISIVAKLPLIFHAIIFAVLIGFFAQLVFLLDKEVIKVAEDFGIEKLTFFTFGRRNRIFVPINRVHKVIINEVIYFVSFLSSFNTLNIINLS